MFDNELNTILESDQIDLRTAVQLINKVRKESGLSTLHIDDELTQVANIHARALAKLMPGLGNDLQRYGHTLPGAKYSSVEDRTRLTRFSTMGEVLASGIVTPTYLVSKWLKSPKHREVVMHPDVDLIGIASSTSKDGTSYIAGMLALDEDEFEDEEDTKPTNNKTRKPQNNYEDEDDEPSLRDIWNTVKKHGKDLGTRAITSIAKSDAMKKFRNTEFAQKLRDALGID